MGFDASAYGSVFASLLTERRLNALDGGTENGSAKGDLDGLSVAGAFEGQSVVDEDMAEACLSAAWLYHNYLDTSHTISQGKVVYADGELNVERGAGRYVDRPAFAPYYDALNIQAQRSEPEAVER